MQKHSVNGNQCCCCCLVAKSCPAFCNPMDCSLPVPLSMGFSRQEYWSGIPLPSPEDLPDPELPMLSCSECYHLRSWPASQGLALPALGWALFILGPSLGQGRRAKAGGVDCPVPEVQRAPHSHCPAASRPGHGEWAEGGENAYAPWNQRLGYSTESLEVAGHLGTRWSESLEMESANLQV